MVARPKRKYRNPHSKFINKRIADIRRSNKWNTKITRTSHKDFIRDFSSTVFSKFIYEAFTKSYVKKQICPDCGEQAEERCHGVGEERPLLIKKALRRVYPRQSDIVCLKDILIAFLEEHKTTRFTFKCYTCHKKETSVLLRKNN